MSGSASAWFFEDHQTPIPVSRARNIVEASSHFVLTVRLSNHPLDVNRRDCLLDWLWIRLGDWANETIAASRERLHKPRIVGLVSQCEPDFGNGRIPRLFKINKGIFWPDSKVSSGQTQRYLLARLSTQLVPRD